MNVDPVFLTRPNLTHCVINPTQIKIKMKSQTRPNPTHYCTLFGYRKLLQNVNVAKNLLYYYMSNTHSKSKYLK